MLLTKSHVVLTALQTQRQNPTLPASGHPHQHTLLHRGSSMAKRPQIASCAHSQCKEASSNADSLLYAAMSESMANLQHAPKPPHLLCSYCPSPGPDNPALCGWQLSCRGSAQHSPPHSLPTTHVPAARHAAVTTQQHIIVPHF